MAVAAEYLTMREFRERFQLSASTAYNLIRQPGFPAYRVGSIRIHVAQLETWLKSHQLCHPAQQLRDGIQMAPERHPLVQSQQRRGRKPRPSQEVK